MAGFLKRRRDRDIALQVAYVACIAFLVIAAVVITRRNMEIQGVTASWDFLERATGWTISFSLLPYEISDTYARALLIGFLNTLFLGSISISLAVLLGTAVGAAQLLEHKLVRLIATTYVQIFRNIPLILQAVFWYTLITHLPPPRSAYDLPGGVIVSNRGLLFPGLNVGGVYQLLAFAVLVFGLIATMLFWRKVSRVSGLATLIASLVIPACVLVAGQLPDVPLFDIPERAGLRFVGGVLIPPELIAAIVSISLFGAAYIAEIVRGGFLSVPKGMTEAGAALGLTDGQIFRRVRLPLMIRIVLPTMTNQIIWLMKATTVGIAIGFMDLFGAVSVSITNSGQTITLIFILIMGFWLINMTISVVMNRINSAIALPGYKK